MNRRVTAGGRRPSVFIVSAAIGLASTLAVGENDASLDAGANALLAIDRHRASVVQHVVSAWGAALAKSPAQMSIDDLRTRLASLRADALLAASLAGTLDGLREVIGADDTSIAAAKSGLMQTKALGDTAADVVYTPVTPCRLVETRGTFAAVYQGNGSASHTPLPFTPNEIRTYTLQGGNGVCLTQLPAGRNPSAVELQVFGMPTTAASGDIEILPQGTVFGSTATMVYVATIPFNTVSTAAKANLVNHQISVQVRGGGAHVAIDVVGYFKVPGNYGGTHTITGIFASDGGGDANTASGDFSTIAGGDHNVASGEISSVGGGSTNTASGTSSTVAGGQGNIASGDASTVGGGQLNTASGIDATVAGGAHNVASAFETFAAGRNVLADIDGCAVLGFFSLDGAANCKGVGNIVRVMADHGLTVDWGPATGNGGGPFWVEINDMTPNKPINVYNGAFLSAGGTWTNASDRAGKERFAVIEPEAVLARLVAMPVTQWNYKAEPGVLRIGPVAQDFHAAFGLGADDVTIAPSDEAGVAFAAIQGLHELVEKKDAELKRQDRELTTMRRELEAIKAKLRM